MDQDILSLIEILPPVMTRQIILWVPFKTNIIAKLEIFVRNVSFVTSLKLFVVFLWEQKFLPDLAIAVSSLELYLVPDASSKSESNSKIVSEFRLEDFKFDLVAAGSAWSTNCRTDLHVRDW
uniref:Uncharacterized protein n=1 Tax=Proboscia inermis TaxID=420281 RepID=A0A7S0GIE2_9STRA